ncbi:hypothetical protein D3C81_655280 [compost metagenome]
MPTSCASWKSRAHATLPSSRPWPRRTACVTRPSSVHARKRSLPRSVPRPRRRRPRKLRLPPRLPRPWLPASPRCVLRSTKPRRARRALRPQPRLLRVVQRRRAATTATTATRRATSVDRVTALPVRCTCPLPIVRAVATATTATTVVARAAVRRPAVATCRAAVATPARTPSSVRPHRSCVKWRSATPSPWPTWRRSSR